MGSMPFDRDAAFTIGVEEELQVVDPETWELVARADEIIGKAEPSMERNLRSELFQSTVEVASDACTDVDELREEILRLRHGVADLLEDEGRTIAAAGTHPFSRWQDQERSEAPRYEQLVEEIGWPARQELIFGLHVHVAVRNPAEAIHVVDHLRPYLPLLLGMSANSPFWQGEDTGLAAARLEILDGMPRTGMPPAFERWEAFDQALEGLKQASQVDDVTMVWWDIRPRRDLGTVEVRIPDLPTEPEASLELAALSQALVAWLAEGFREGAEPPLKHPQEVIEENRWRAVRSGYEAELVQLGEEGEVEAIALPQALERTLERLEPIAEELGVEDALKAARARTRSGASGAARQRAVHEERGDLRAVARDLAARALP